MTDRIQRGDEIQDLQRPQRIGRVLHVRGHSVRIAWPSGRTTSVRTRFIGPTSRHYHVITSRPRAPRQQSIAIPTTIAACRNAEGDWVCCACTNTSRSLLRPWWALLWTTGPWQGKSTVVCSDACRSRVRSVANAT